MYIPITKTEEKCAGQLFYGFNIQDKLEGYTHEKKNSLWESGFFHLKKKVNELLTGKCSQILQVLREKF